MSRTILAHQPPWLGVLLLLTLFATLLPVQRAAADATVSLSAQEVNVKVYTDWLSQQYSRHWKNAGRVESYIRGRLVADQLLSEAALYDADVVLKQIDALNERYYKRLGPRGTDPAYRDSLPNTVVAEAMFAAALETPVFRDDVQKAYRQLKETSAQGLAEGSWSAAELAAYRTFVEGNVLVEASRTLLDEKLDQAANRAAANQVFAKTWDAVFAPVIGVKLEDFDARTFLASHPDAAPTAIQNAIKPDGSLDISLADLEKLAKSEFTKINASIDDMQQTLATLSEQQGELVDFMRNQEARQKAQALAEAKAKEHQLKLQAASSAVSIISTLVSLKNPKLGKQIHVVGNSAIKIGESLYGWMQATAGLNGLSKIGSLSTVVMTGNVLGAVMNIVSLFGPQQPTPEQMILEEIGKLRQDVSQLRTEMHTRFDQIDQQLNTIYSSMNERFNQIDLQLGKITTSLEEIQQSLLAIGTQLNRLERNNTEYFDTLGRRPLREAINGALDYHERTGLNMPYQPDFVNYENLFHTWGTINAFDALSAGPTERNYSDGQVLAELSAAPLDANLNYLNGWLVAHGMQPFATRRLPSPRDWAFAARAYADLGQDWPAHLKRIAATRQAALDTVGADLQRALQNISTIQTPGGPQGNAPLWGDLADYYNAKLAGLDTALAASEAAFVAERQAELKRPTPFALYGGLDQSLAYQPADFTNISCGGRYNLPLQTPFNLKSVVSGYNRFALTDYLQLKPLLVCFAVEYVEVSNECYPTPQVCTPYGKLKVALTVMSDQVVLLRSEVVGTRQQVIDPLAALSRDWLFYKRRFEAAFAGASGPIPLTPAGEAQLALVSTMLTNKLNELQRAHAGRVQSGLSSGPLQTRAVELAGAKKLFESFVTLGFPQAVGNDDFLRSLLFSKEALVDDQQVVLAYTPPALSATAAMNAAQLLANPRTRLLETGKKRREALSGLLTDYMGSISTQNYQEDNALISSARFDMTMARAMTSPTRPLPGQNRVIFLPLVRR